MKPAAQLLALAGLLVLAGCGAETGTEAHAVSEVERWDRAMDWIACSEPRVRDVASSRTVGRYYVLRAECRYAATHLRDEYEGTTYFRVSFRKDPFGGWEAVRIHRFSDHAGARLLERGRSLDRTSSAEEIIRHTMVSVTLPAALVCGVVLGGALMWHWRRR